VAILVPYFFWFPILGYFWFSITGPKSGYAEIGALRKRRRNRRFAQTGTKSALRANGDEIGASRKRGKIGLRQKRAKIGEVLFLSDKASKANLALISQNFIFSFSYRDFSHFGARFALLALLIKSRLIVLLLILLFSFIKRKK
jgi:hypothetical protein